MAGLKQQIVFTSEKLEIYDKPSQGRVMTASIIRANALKNIKIYLLAP